MQHQKKLSIRTVILSISGALGLAPAVWLFFCLYLGVLNWSHLFSLLTDPLYLSWVFLACGGSLVITRRYTRAILRHGDDMSPEGARRCARGVRMFVPVIQTCIILYCLIGVGLAKWRLSLDFPLCNIQLFGLAVGSVMLTILPPGINAYIWVEKNTAHQSMSEDYIPMPLSMRLGLIGGYIAVGIIMTLVSAGVAVAAQLDLSQVEGIGSIVLLMKKLLVVGGVILFFAFANTLQLFRVIVIPIRELGEKLMKGMDGDLSIRSKRTTWDDIGMLSVRFNDFMVNLQQVMGRTSRITGELSKSGEALKGSVNETVSAVSQIHQSIDHTGRRLESQQVNVAQTTAAVEEISTNISSLDRSIEQQASNLTQSSSAVEEMVANIASILNIVQTAAESIETLRESSRMGREELDRMNDLIRQISGRSAQLMEANTLISSVADQTNLLAMNAAIEAAHAGEAGRGFSVVADEIRKLAETSTNQSTHIAKDLNTMAGNIEEVVQRASTASERFSQVFEEVDQVHQVNREIENSMEEQRQGGDELLHALASLNEITAQVQTGSREMNRGSGDILRAVQDLNTISEEIRGAMEEIRTGTGAIRTAVDVISINEESNNTNIKACEREISRFRV